MQVNNIAWQENPGIYLGKEESGGIVISGPVSAKEAGIVITKSVMKKEPRVVAYKSENGQPPVLEIIMEVLYRDAAT